MKADVAVELDTILARPGLIAVVSVTNAADGTPVAGLKASGFRAFHPVMPSGYGNANSFKIAWFRAYATPGLYAMVLRAGPLSSGHYVVAIRVDGHGSGGWGKWNGEGIASGTIAPLPTARSTRTTARKRRRA